MKIYRNYLIGVLLSFLIIIPWAQSDESLEELVSEVSRIQSELRNLPTSNLEENIIIDDAISVLDEAFRFAKSEILVSHILVGHSTAYLAAPPKRSIDSALLLSQNKTFTHKELNF